MISKFGVSYDNLDVKNVELVLAKMFSDYKFKDLKVILPGKEGVMFSVLISLIKSDRIEFDFTDKSYLDYVFLRKIFLRMLEFLEECYEFLEVNYDISGFMDSNPRQFSNIQKIVVAKVAEVVAVAEKDMSMSELIFEYSMELYYEFDLDGSLESAVKSDYWGNHLKVLKLLKTRLKEEDESDIEEILSFIFRKQLNGGLILNDTEYLILKNAFREIFGLELESRDKANNTEKDESDFVPPHNFKYDTNAKLSSKQIKSILKNINAEFLKKDSQRLYYKLNFQGGGFIYSYNVSVARQSGIKFGHMLNAFKSHPNSLKLLSLSDADKICEAFNANGLSLSYEA